jgi:hypothetical protein
MYFLIGLIIFFNCKEKLKNNETKRKVRRHALDASPSPD